jgi:pimeloyl-ACP methyl ester carboxylesterase
VSATDEVITGLAEVVARGRPNVASVKSCVVRILRSSRAHQGGETLEIQRRQPPAHQTALLVRYSRAGNSPATRPEIAMPAKPNILLVHGAWGDAAHWARVISLLHAKGYHIVAVENPLTSLPDDIDRTSKLAAAQGGPTLLVGHSYGGAVITGAGHAPNVVGLVYIAAFAPDEGESLGGIFARGAQPPGAANIRPDKDGFLWINADAFRESFGQDLSDSEALVMAVTQKPIAARCFEDKSGPPAWKSKPSWYQVSAQDRMIPPDTESWMAKRIGAKKTVTLQASHASLASHPKEVAALIDEAASALAA